MGAGSTFSGTANAWAGADYYSATGATSVVGTNGATFYITGVQLEKGSTATSFDYRPYGQELALCQRYYYKITAPANDTRSFIGYAYSSTITVNTFVFKQPMRVAPSALEQSGTASHYGIYYAGTAVGSNQVPTHNVATTEYAVINVYAASGPTAGQAVQINLTTANSSYLGWSAEL